MTFKFIPSREGIGEVSVIAAESDFMQEVAQAIATKARDLAKQDGLDSFAASIKVETSVRPKGRGMVEVFADDDDAARVEFGDGGTVARRRILGRAAGVELVRGDGVTP